MMIVGPTVGPLAAPVWEVGSVEGGKVLLGKAQYIQPETHYLLNLPPFHNPVDHMMMRSLLQLVSRTCLSLAR